MKKTRLLNFLFLVLLTFFSKQIIVNAEEIIVNNYSQLKDAFLNENVDVIKLGDNIDLSLTDEQEGVFDTYNSEPKEYYAIMYLNSNETSFDLNGHTLEIGNKGFLIKSLSNGKIFNIIDSSSSKTGKIISTNYDLNSVFEFQTCDNNGCHSLSVNIEGGYYEFGNNPEYYNTLSYFDKLNKGVFISIADEEKTQTISINNVVVKGHIFIKGCFDVVTAKNVILKHYTELVEKEEDYFKTLFMYNEYGFKINQIVPATYKVIKDYKVISKDNYDDVLSTSNDSDIYIAKDDNTLTYDGFLSTYSGYDTAQNVPLIFNNTTDDKLIIKQVKLEDDSAFSLIGNNEFEISSNSTNNIDIQVTYKNGLLPGKYLTNVIAYDSNNNLYVLPIELEIKAIDSTEYEGSGTENDPYLIKNSLDLYNIRNNLSAYYKLVNNLDLTNDTQENYGIFSSYLRGWDSISGDDSFTGNFDGNGHKIKGIYQRIINSENYNQNITTGLFGNIKGTVKNLEIDNFIINYADIKDTYRPNIGVLGSYISDSTIDNVTVSGEILVTYGSSYYKYLQLGGLAGSIENSSLQNITNKVNLNIGDTYLFTSGGVASEIRNSVLNNIVNYGDIYGASSGGISCYLMDSVVTNVKNYGTINAKSGGGIAFQFSGSKLTYGSNYGTLNMVTKETTNNRVGGLVGILSYSSSQENNGGTIEKSFNTGTINASHGDIGGLVGSSYGNNDDGTKPVFIKDSYNVGELNVTNYYTVGGLVGRSSSHIENSYNAGNINILKDNNDSHVSEIVGAIVRMTTDNSAGSLDKVYYIGRGIQSFSNDGGGILLNTSELSFEQAIKKDSYNGFDFDNIWEIKDNYPFPQLKSNQLEGEFIKKITITNEETNLISENEYQLTYSITPSNFTNDDIIFEIIEGNNLASIDSNGKLSLVGEGKIKVKVSSKKVNDIYVIKEFNLIIIKDINELNILNINDVIYDGEEKKPEIEIYDGDYQLTSNDYEVEYSNNINPGKATLTITGKSNYKGIAEISFNIISPLTSIILDKTSGEKNVGQTESLTVTYNPTNTTDDKTVTWKSSNSNIASVDKNGVVTAKGPGKATITATVGTKSATYIITVYSPLNSISLDRTSLTIDKGKTDILTVTYNPTNTTDDKTITWKSSDSNIIKVENGKITAINYGKATITAAVGTQSASCEVIVNTYPLNSITLNELSGEIVVGENKTLIVTYNPTNTTDDKTVTWKSSDSNIAFVDKNGVVTAKGPGKATITATVGTKSATYNLIVKDNTNLVKIITETGFKISNEFVHGFTVGDTINSLKNKFENKIVFNTSNTKIGTGVQLKYNNEIATAVILGDLTGEGDINSADLLKMRQYLLGTTKLDGAYKQAGAIANGTTINSADLLRLRQHLLGTNIIKQ